jgi:hypothetical protein
MGRGIKLSDTEVDRLDALRFRTDSADVFRNSSMSPERAWYFDAIRCLLIKSCIADALRDQTADPRPGNPSSSRIV